MEVIQGSEQQHPTKIQTMQTEALTSIVQQPDANFTLASQKLILPLAVYKNCTKQIGTSSKLYQIGNELSLNLNGFANTISDNSQISNHSSYLKPTLPHDGEPRKYFLHFSASRLHAGWSLS